MRKLVAFAPIALAALMLAGCTSSSDTSPEPDPTPTVEETTAAFNPDTVVTAPAPEVATTMANILKQNSGTDAKVDCGDGEFQLKDGATVECKLIDVDKTEYKVTAVVMLTSDGSSYALSPRVMEDAS